MTNAEAINILDQATQPQNVGKLTRQDYCQTQAALEALAAALKAVATGNPEQAQPATAVA